MGIKLKQFLDEHGFQKNPFATTNAEQETELLSSFFVRAAWFDQLVGDPQRPESLILYAPQGHGKTSHRIEVGRRAGEHPETPALVVTLNDFSTLLRGGLDQITIDTYIVVLRRLCLEALDDHLQQSAERLNRLKQDEAQWTLFRALLHLYAPRQVVGQPIPTTVQEQIDAIKQTDSGPKEWLKDLSTLAHCAGFASVYVLLDGIDELRETKGNTEAMLRLISPLLEAPGLLQECDFAFKFFLPQDIEAPMYDRKVGRLDRIPCYSLAWSSDQLCEMLSKRLETHSLISSTNPTGLVSRFKDLCAVDFDVDRDLASASSTSPRRMLDLARQIVVEHCALVSDLKHLIAADSIAAVLQRNAIQVTLPTVHAPSDGQGRARSLADEITIPQLYVDGHGDVWLGANCRDAELSPLLRKCLAYLWTHRHQHVSYEDLKCGLYGESFQNRGDPQSSVEKLIRRLREYLEPGQPSSHHYIDVQAGFGYVLRNFREE